MNNNILRIRAVSKCFEDHQALNSVSFDVPKGGVFGLLGPNGAGKTTLIRIITNITQADEGSVIFEGTDTKYLDRGLIGYMPEERGLYKKMKVAEQLEYFAALRNMPVQEARQRIGFWLERLNISDWAYKKIEELSKGMQQKIQFIATVLHNPSFLILDEPFSGLDPVNTSLLKDEILRLNQLGTTIMFSTHRMEQVEEICDRIVLISKGKNILDSTVKETKETWKEGLFHLEFEHTIEFTGDMPEGIEIKENKGNELYVKAPNLRNLNTFITSQINKGNLLHSMKERLPTLNEIFIKTVRRENPVPENS
ncbi:MAG TPA: ATP-binding cassette domain-containing protein [Saprospiraceae bacterium]|mgnify:FL=1|jgi:ABC-2 type transport system ATP-binding protein|nr:ATP-binding cassette domain-containing protein [Saprospiraceae bacterium]MBX7178979.1 ATP-binding cassette domain-containing protein [Saprospiraceae bacterium]MCB0590751.1 ATP-binding cassette domain-containing protein [Saprospiraceae bacterium]MCO5284668.1 ATP-binding cassette domain-containing protein [Saprospiraceae bacterium]MCO6471826.1 ATP-binding cassette domain-containing protein [Saprospiraceae bacterium]